VELGIWGMRLPSFGFKCEELLIEPDRLEIFVSDINRTEYKRRREVIKLYKV